MNEGSLTFTLPGVPSLTVGVNGAGEASATLQLPPGFALGGYPLTARYADSSNANGTTDFASSSGATLLTVAPLPTAVTIQQILILPMDGFAVEVLTALVSSSTGPLNDGIVTFTLDGQVLPAAVQSGQARAITLVPLPLVARPEYLSAPSRHRISTSPAAMRRDGRC